MEKVGFLTHDFAKSWDKNLLSIISYDIIPLSIPKIDIRDYPLRLITLIQQNKSGSPGIFNARLLHLAGIRTWDGPRFKLVRAGSLAN